MFTGLVATASNRSGSGSDSAVTSPSASEYAVSQDEAVAERHAPSFPSPYHVTNSSPRTDGGAPPESAEFLSPYSVGGYPTPSTGYRHGRYAATTMTAHTDASPSVPRTWAIEFGEEERGEDNDAMEVIVDEPDVALSTSSSRTDHHSENSGEGKKGEVDDENKSEEVGEAQRQVAPALPSVAQQTASPSSSLRHKSLNELANERSSSSSSSSSSAAGQPMGGPTRLQALLLSSSTPMQRLTNAPPLSDGPTVTEVLQTPPRVFSSSQPVTASTLVATFRRSDAHPRTRSGSPLLPTTPPLHAARLSPLSPHSTHSTSNSRISDSSGNQSRNERQQDAPLVAEKEEEEGEERSATQVGKLSATAEASAPLSGMQKSLSSSSALSSASSQRIPSGASTPCAPPPDSPPDSAIKRAPGAVVVMERRRDDEEARTGQHQQQQRQQQQHNSHNNSDVGGLDAADADGDVLLRRSADAEEPGWRVADTAMKNGEYDDDDPAHHSNNNSSSNSSHDYGSRDEELMLPVKDASPLLFSVCYTEEEHRVQLETHETEERRCLFRAYRAVLTLYQMWAAEDREERQRLLLMDTSEAVAPPLIADRPSPQATGSVRSSSAASTLEKVEHFIHSSVSAARERRSGSAQSATAEAAMGGVGLPPPPPPPLPVSSSFVAAPALTYRSDAVNYSGTALTSPAASRLLDYSSLGVPEARGASTNTSFDTTANTATVENEEETTSRHRPPAAPRSRLQPEHAHSARLFSPWRGDVSAVNAADSVGKRHSFSTVGSDGEARRSRRGSYTKGVATTTTTTNFTPRVPHLRRTSPLSSRADPSPSSAPPPAVSPPPPRTHHGGSESRVDVEREQHLWSTVASSRRPATPPSVSLLSEAFLSLTRRRDAEMRSADQSTGEVNVLVPRHASHSPALVRSPRESATGRLRSPPWKTSSPFRPSVSSSTGNAAAAATAAAALFSQQRSPRDNVTSRPSFPAGSSRGFASNNAFRQRQRAASLHSNDDAFEAKDPVAAAPSQQLGTDKDDQQQRQERRTSYVQYKRFFDAVYGNGSGGVPPRGTETRGAAPSWGHEKTTSTEKVRDGHVFPSKGQQRDASRTSPLRFATSGATSRAATQTPSLPAATAQRAPALQQRWSPDTQPRRAVPQPTQETDVQQSALRHSRTQLSSPSTSVTQLRSSSEAALRAPRTSLREMFAARLERLDTLETLCRAEVQRRWMEDQNVLLHQFIVEGTATLQRGRGTVLSRQPPPRDVAVRDDVVDEARAWTFIPNEMA